MANSNFGRRPGRRQVEARTPRAPVRCGECNTFHQRTHCPECGQVPREAWVSVLYSQVETQGGDRLAVAAERAEDGSWSPIQVERVGGLDHGTRWGGDMTRTRTTAGRILRLVARTAWLVVRVLAASGVVRLARAVVGVWPTAAGLAAVSVMWGLWGWQRLERRLDARERRLLAAHAYLVKYFEPGGRAVQADHVAFARALAAVSARYLAHCEDQADEQQTRTGEAWR